MPIASSRIAAVSRTGSPPASTIASRSGATSRSQLAAVSAGKRSLSRTPLIANGRVFSAASGLRACSSTPSIHARTRGASGLDPAHPPLERLDQAPLAVVEHRDEERVLAREVAVEGLVREAGFLHDVADPGLDVAGAGHHRVRGVEQPAHLAGVALEPPGDRPLRQLVLDAPWREGRERRSARREWYSPIAVDAPGRPGPVEPGTETAPASPR